MRARSRSLSMESGVASSKIFSSCLTRLSAWVARSKTVSTLLLETGNRMRGTFRLLALAFMPFGALPAAVTAQPAPPVPFDVVIRGGLVLDGSGSPPFRADVGIRNGRIAAVGELPAAEARTVVDAAGRLVTPGFVDIHSHADDNVRRRPTLRDPDVRRKAAPNLVTQGITTVVVNHDGRSPWPIAEQRRVLEEEGTGPNVVLLVGHGEVRRQVMGQDAERPATPQEVLRMRTLVRRAMEEGAFGLSAGLEYDPGRWSTTDELVALVDEIVPWDGVYISHERSEGSDPMWYWPSQDPPDPPTLLDAVAETIEIGRRTGARVVASHIKAKGAHYWGTSADVIEMIQAARDEGVRIWADQYPYATSGSDGGTVLLPRWAIRGPEGVPPAELLERALMDPVLEARVRTDVTHEIRRRGGADRVVIFDYPDSALVGRSLQEVSDALGVDPVDAAIALQLQGDRGRPGGGRLRGFSMSEADVERYAAVEWVATATDGGLALPEDGPVHARYYGTFPRKIRRYALEREVMSLEAAVRSSTALPAEILGLQDIGRIAVGAAADIVVLDADRIADRATFFEPHQHADGIDFVLVGGVPVVADGRPTLALPGRIIPSARRRAPTLQGAGR